MAYKVLPDWEQRTMGPRMTFTGMAIPVKTEIHISTKELLEFIGDNWMYLDLKDRDKFLKRVQRMELGLEDPPYKAPEGESRF